MHVRKRLFTFLFAALVMALLTACGKWDYSREAMKAANEAQGDTLRVEFKVNQTFTNALRAAAEDNIQPADVDKAMTMDKSIEKLLSSGYRLDVYALRADIDADQAAAQLADEFVNRLAGCEDEGYISMVKADNSYFYMAVLTYKHGDGSSGGDDGAGDTTGGDDDGNTGTSWVTLENGVLTLRKGASKHINPTLDGIWQVMQAVEYGNTEVLMESDRYKIADELINNGQLHENDRNSFIYDFYSVTELVVEEESGITTIGRMAANTWNCALYNKPMDYSLQRIELHGVKTIVDYGFIYNAGLTEADLNDVTTLGLYAFGSNEELVSIYLPNITSVDSAAFAGCYKLAHIGFGSQLRSFGTNVFDEAGSKTSDKPLTIYYDTGSEEDIWGKLEDMYDDESEFEFRYDDNVEMKFKPFDEFPDEFK